MVAAILGLGTWVGLAYVLCIVSALMCIVYGLVNWNRGEEPLSREDVEWEKSEEEAEEIL